MNIFFYEDYKNYLKDYIKDQRQNGRGFATKMSAALNLHVSHVSAVVNGDKDFTFEQLYSLANFLKLSASESEYFMLIGQYCRAGNHEYKQYLKNKVDASREKGLIEQKAFNDRKELTPDQQSIFYSSWIYPALHLYCSAGNGKTFEEIKRKFNLETDKLNEILNFLTSSGLCHTQKNHYMSSQVKTLITGASPLWVNNHKNWRIKSMQKSEDVAANEILYTSAMTISRSDFDYIRDELLKTINSFSKRIDESPSEELACLNIDWFFIN
ncbi:MAG: TIGR02147 family protein [Pseudobdellovibrionaceae bacterium]